MAQPPHLLLIPRSGPDGIGECVRALVLARAAARRWPGARIEFVTHSRGTWLEGRGFPHHRVEGGASRNAEGAGSCRGYVAAVAGAVPDISAFWVCCSIQVYVSAIPASRL